MRAALPSARSVMFATPNGYAYLTIACRDIVPEYDVSDEGPLKY